MNVVNDIGSDSIFSSNIGLAHSAFKSTYFSNNVIRQGIRNAFSDVLGGLLRTRNFLFGRRYCFGGIPPFTHDGKFSDVFSGKTFPFFGCRHLSFSFGAVRFAFMGGRHFLAGFVARDVIEVPVTAIGEINQLASHRAEISNPFPLGGCPISSRSFHNSENWPHILSYQFSNPVLFVSPLMTRSGHMGSKALCGINRKAYIADFICSWVTQGVNAPLTVILNLHGSLYYSIAFCGYADGRALPPGWEEVPWKARKGYQKVAEDGSHNGHREVIWFSPHCLKPDLHGPLFM